MEMLTLHPDRPHAPADARWVDLLDPDDADAALVASTTGLRVPTRDELREIETSSRTSVRDGVLYLSLPLVRRTAEGEVRVSPVGFVLSQDRLLTVRFDKFPVFETFIDACRKGREPGTSLDLLLALLEAMVDRLADGLEREGDGMDRASHRIFRNDGHTSRRPRLAEAEMRVVLRQIGATNDLISKIRDTLLSIGRIVPFAQANTKDWNKTSPAARFDVLRADVQSLTDYDTHLSNKAQFLLDATIGFIGIEQSNIIRVLTVVSVVGVPPTFVASMYGMNFKIMPELNWTWGYPYALVLIALSAVLPLLWFRLRGWL
jgi:magnesium transporter